MTSPAQLSELPEGGLSGIFDGTVPPGVYRTSAVGPDALLQAQAEGWQAVVVDLGGVTDKAGALAGFETGLELPVPLEDGWDALADKLTDLSWLGSSRGHLVLVSGWGAFEEAAPRDAESVVEVLAAAVGYWAVRTAPLAAVLG